MKMTQLPTTSKYDMDTVRKAVNLWFMEDSTLSQISVSLSVDIKTIRRWIQNHVQGPKQVEGHQHSWFIEQPDGPQSLGSCEKCRSTKYFWNSIEADSTWLKQRDRSYKEYERRKKLMARSKKAKKVQNEKA